MLNHRVVRSVLVQVSQRWIVEAAAAEQFGGSVGHHGEESDVNDFGGMFTQHVHTQQT